ncbi:GNAT family N-acetyltransferase [Bacillus massiliglaciei]|uniref:GNAT family N-acetyltransferase n=1 Tax=Bacillus massiliglaciei TaxID=1816693 RepID=UPI000B0AFE41|nr:GNAT family N-acetyltransferase [Bacillus massiliglaciei]
MNWYEKLKQYFPIEEMKSKEHMELLLKDKEEFYKKDESKHHVLMYVEDPEFIFVDYLFVAETARGQGLGKQLIQKLQQKGKPILLEVEPVLEEDDDTRNRLRFYKREGFVHASNISYYRNSLATKEINKMEILYWSPKPVPEESIFRYMKKVYEQIHTYQDVQLYGGAYDASDKAIRYSESGQTEDILEEVR